jgi:AraC family transcriptional regulator
MQFSAGESFAPVVKKHRVHGWTFSETVYPNRFDVPRHSHQHAFFYIVLEGAYTDRIGSQTLSCSPSSLVFHPEADEHSHHFESNGGRCFNIDVGPIWIERLQQHEVYIQRPVLFDKGAVGGLASRLYMEFLQSDPLSFLVMEGLALEILSEASRCIRSHSDSRPPHWMRHVLDLLHSHFTSTLTLEEIAGTVGIHPVHLARTFRQHQRCTVGDYLRRLRIESACQLLAHSSKTLLDIALDTGFSDQSHFNRTFKRIVGYTPLEYRLRHRSC